MLIDRIVFEGGPRGHRRYADPMVAPFEHLSIRFRDTRLNVAMPEHYMGIYGSPHREDREEYGRRLRYAVRDVAGTVERELIDHLRGMGHIL